MVIVKLPYGVAEIAIDLRGLRVRALRPGAPPGQSDSGAIVAEALDAPVAGRPLAELARGRRSATVVVPDATRKMDLANVLPTVFDRLRVGGVEDNEVTVLIACGTHPHSGDAAARELVGSLPDGVTLVEHDCRDRDVVVKVGELRPGIPLRLHRKAVEADLLITIGGVRHHYFAGFGGGPKMIFPGVAGYDEIQANHGLVLRTTGSGLIRNPGCEPGRLIGNPVAEEIARSAKHLEPEMALCTVEGRDGGTAWATAGPCQQAFDAAVERSRLWFEIPIGDPLDFVVACGGGAPTDSTLIQAHKAFDAGCRFLREGGEILYFAALEGGAGSPEMEPFLENPQPESILAALGERWVQYGHTTLRIVEKTHKYRALLRSEFPPERALALGFDPVADTEAVLDRWRAEFPGATVGVMASSAVYPRTVP